MSDHDPYFEPEWCERCGMTGHNGLRCAAEDFEEGDDDDADRTEDA